MFSPEPFAHRAAEASQIPKSAKTIGIPRKAKMKCKCLDEMGEKLKAENLKLSDKHLGFTMPKFELSLYFFMEWIDKTKIPNGKRTPPKLLVSFCPFCGQSTKGEDELLKQGEKNL
jgi:hypothetical protein